MTGERPRHSQGVGGAGRDDGPKEGAGLDWSGASLVANLCDPTFTAVLLPSTGSPLVLQAAGTRRQGAGPLESGAGPALQAHLAQGRNKAFIVGVRPETAGAALSNGMWLGGWSKFLRR